MASPISSSHPPAASIGDVQRQAILSYIRVQLAGFNPADVRRSTLTPIELTIPHIPPPVTMTMTLPPATGDMPSQQQVIQAARVASNMSAYAAATASAPAPPAPPAAASTQMYDAAAAGSSSSAPPPPPMHRAEPTAASVEGTSPVEDSGKKKYIQLILASPTFAHIGDSSYRDHHLRRWLESLSTRHLLLVGWSTRVFGDYQLQSLKDSRKRDRKTGECQCLTLIDSKGRSHATREMAWMTKMIFEHIKPHGKHAVTKENITCIHDKYGRPKEQPNSSKRAKKSTAASSTTDGTQTGTQSVASSASAAAPQPQPAGETAIECFPHTGLYWLWSVYQLPSAMLACHICIKDDPSRVLRSVSYLRSQLFVSADAADADADSNLLCCLLEKWAAPSGQHSNQRAAPAAAANINTMPPEIDIGRLCDELVADGISVPRNPSFNPREFVLQVLLVNMQLDRLDLDRLELWLQSHSSIRSSSIPASIISSRDQPLPAPTVSASTMPPVVQPTSSSATPSTCATIVHQSNSSSSTSMPMHPQLLHSLSIPSPPLSFLPAPVLDLIANPSKFVSGYVSSGPYEPPPIPLVPGVHTPTTPTSPIVYHDDDDIYNYFSSPNQSRR